MKTNKVGLIALMALGGLVTFSPLANAQSTNTPPAGDHQRGPRGDMRERAAKIAAELGLSDDQKTKWQEVMKDQMQQAKAIHDDQNLSQNDRRTKIKALREATNEKIKGILTAEQYAKWQKIRPGRPHGEGKPPGDAPANN